MVVILLLLEKSLIFLSIFFSVVISTAEVTSSNNRIFGFLVKILARAKRCFCPPEKFEAFNFTLESSLSGSLFIKSEDIESFAA